MATKSFLKIVDIKDKQMAKDFISALENAQNKHRDPVVMSKTVKKLSKEQIIHIFGEPSQ